MKLFVDDQWDLPDRFPGEGWTCVRTAEEAIGLLYLNKGKVTHLSLDADLGEGKAQGGDAVAFLAEQWFRDLQDFYPTEELTIRSRNPVERKWFQQALLRWNPRPEIVKNRLL